MSIAKRKFPRTEPLRLARRCTRTLFRKAWISQCLNDQPVVLIPRANVRSASLVLAGHASSASKLRQVHVPNAMQRTLPLASSVFRTMGARFARNVTNHPLRLQRLLRQRHLHHQGLRHLLRLRLALLHRRDAQAAAMSRAFRCARQIRRSSSNAWQSVIHAVTMDQALLPLRQAHQVPRRRSQTNVLFV